MATEHLDPNPGPEFFRKHPQFITAANAAEQRRLDRRFMVRMLIAFLVIGIVGRASGGAS